MQSRSDGVTVFFRYVDLAELRNQDRPSRASDHDEGLEIQRLRREVELSCSLLSFCPCVSAVRFSATMDLRRGSASAGWRPLKRRKSVPKSVRAGLQFPVARIARRLREGRYAKRLGSTAPVFLASVLEYLTAEVQPQSSLNRLCPSFVHICAISPNFRADL